MATYAPMAASTRPPRLEFAAPGANPTLRTLEYIRAILRRADGPISRNEVLRQLAAWGHATTRKSLNAAIRFLAVDGSVAEGSKGLIWVPEARGPVRDAIRKGERL